MSSLSKESHGSLNEKMKSSFGVVYVALTGEKRKLFATC